MTTPENANKTAEALKALTGYRLNLNFALGDSIINEKARDLLTMIANLPDTPPNIKAEIVNALGDVPKPVVKPAPVKVEEIDKRFSLTEDEKQDLASLVATYSDAAEALNGEIDDYNGTLENQWSQVDSAKDDYNEAVNGLDYFLSDIRDRMSDAEVTEDSDLLSAWNEVYVEEYDEDAPDVLDELDYDGALRDLTGLPTS